MSGADANENAVKMAVPLVTGRHKVLARLIAPDHGATYGAISLTGTNPRAWGQEPGLIPWCGALPRPVPVSQRALSRGRQRRRLCAAQPGSDRGNPDIRGATHGGGDPHGRTATGTNGVIIPPDGYLQGVRGLCDRYGILLICDEVMTGFGRTGAWFGVDDRGVTPDIITMAKGLTSAAAAQRSGGERVCFTTPPTSTAGSTYSAHPLCLARCWRRSRDRGR